MPRSITDEDAKQRTRGTNCRKFITFNTATKFARHGALRICLSGAETVGYRMMIDLDGLVEQLFESFEKSAAELFRQFIKANRAVKKWIIAADYCLDDQTHPNDSFVFSIIPYDDWLDGLKEEIKGVLPRDIKDTKNLAPATTKFLASSRRFHIGVLVNRDRSVFIKEPGKTRLDIARESIELTYQHLVNAGRSRENLRAVKKLREQSRRKSFNVSLLSDVYLLALLFAFVSIVLAREVDLQMLGWFSDPDNMTTWCDQVLWTCATENLHGLADKYGVKLRKGAHAIAVPGKRDHWFDEFVRISDHIAGLLAAWDFKTNQVPGNGDKYIRLAEDVAADSKNMSILKIQIDKNGTRCSHIVAHADARHKATTE